MSLLVSWTGKIRDGDFISEERIESRDEIQVLAENFNVMRYTLKENFEKIEAQNHDLLEMKNNLEILVSQRTSELKDAMEKLKESNQRLEHLSVVDPLTQAYNRRYLETVLAREVSRAKREKIPLSIIMLDLDNFKNINDTYGHQIGDSALVTTADVLKNVAKRDVDICSRYGGEEFIVVLPQTNEKGAFTIAEEIRKEISVAEIGEKLHFTCSVGVHTFNGDTSEDMEFVIKKCDDAMYLAKGKGKNRVEVL